MQMGAHRLCMPSSRGLERALRRAAAEQVGVLRKAALGVGVRLGRGDGLHRHPVDAQGAKGSGGGDVGAGQTKGALQGCAGCKGGRIADSKVPVLLGALGGGHWICPFLLLCTACPPRQSQPGSSQVVRWLGMLGHSSHWHAKQPV